MGVTILAVLALIGGIFALIGGLGLIAGGALLGGVVGGSQGVALGSLAFIFGIVTLGIGVADIAFAYGAWTLKQWGWALGILIAIFSLVWIAVTGLASGDLVGTITSSIISIAIWAVVLWYLNTPDVKRAFGRP
jgi:hypothetical protein